ncbi:carboxypeptidase-like regulatory domain-containing protein [Flavobacterium sp. S87F.05.LMB.W.Kidney.N]|uniref:carboxypeptidase-like regulatory domain-containing protein n=1 Tax=Flavobacterium sp. S87F.05.LMB.W.Kidney.N TaxID=1278758 RepID=UPI001064D5CD|nr:carboxypeptidase-like regulatory domain-containing protein [Flavobacterium sp. S87F.05.LMB.W.Kidney.N]TDX14224.1 carboxypeptidase-like protein [Flavobacterium sp. S87F.05.LMB.W.Kidney.N]
MLLIFVQIGFGQKNNSKELLGRIMEQSTPIEGVNIINNTTQVATISDSDGNFSIAVREGDVLVFSAVNLDPLKLRITTEDLASNLLVVKMTAKEVELREVVVNENANITAENLGIIPYGQKKYTPAERKVYTANSTSVDKLLNAISGRTAMLKKEVNVEKKEALFRKLEYLFDENYYTERLKIPVDYIKGFQLFCVEDAEFAVSLNTKNKTMSMFLITDLARKYLTILENEK